MQHNPTQSNTNAHTNLMKSPIFLPCIAAGIGLLASCYPIPDEPRNGQPQPSETTVTAEQQRRIEEQRERMRQEAARRQQQERQTETQPRETTTPTPPPRETVQSSDFPFATPVPGKEGFVFSPYNNKVVDVRDIASGQLVQDPTFPPAERKYFRVP